jgi:hypothetical protein
MQSRIACYLIKLLDKMAKLTTDSNEAKSALLFKMLTVPREKFCLLDTMNLAILIAGGSGCVASVIGILILAVKRWSLPYDAAIWLGFIFIPFFWMITICYIKGTLFPKETELIRKDYKGLEDIEDLSGLFSELCSQDVQSDLKNK